MTHSITFHTRVVPLRHRPIPITRRSLSIRAVRSTDLVGFANVCLDVHIPVPVLPSRVSEWRRQYMAAFVRAPPEAAVYEVGGVCNTLFAAARLGLNTAAMGHVGDDNHGRHCLESLEKESVEYSEAFKWEVEGTYIKHPFLKETALCLVIVDPMRRHLFCSKFQVTPGPVFIHPHCLKPSSIEQIANAKALLMNGYAFQECSPSVLEFIFDTALSAGTATFFDPGPYGVSLVNGSNADRASLMSILRRCNVVLATEEEAQALTGHTDLVAACQKLLDMTDVMDWVVVKLGAKGSLFLKRGGKPCITPGFEVDVKDTVGCGDSFAGAVVYGYLNGQGQSEGVMELANAVGAVTATRQGAGRNVAKLENVRGLLEVTLEGRSSGNGGSGIAAALELLEKTERFPTELHK